MIKQIYFIICCAIFQNVGKFKLDRTGIKSFKYLFKEQKNKNN